MLHRSLGASSFARFWRFWNPIWGYYLGRYFYRPLDLWQPQPLALLLTFVISGALHDLATMAVRGSVTFLFTPWFFFLAVGVLVGEALRMDLTVRPWWVRAATHLTYLGVCLGLAWLIRL